MLSAAMKPAKGRDQRKSPTSQRTAGQVNGGNTPNKVEMGPAQGLQRMLFALQLLQGYEVQVQVRDGTLYDGVFSGFQREGTEVGVVLKMARVLEAPTGEEAPPAPYLPELYVRPSDLVKVVAKNVRMGAQDLGTPSASEDTGGLSTDSAISRGRWGGKKDLQRWEPAPGEEAVEGLESTPYQPGWNQFEINREKFNVKSTWDENLYTTRLDVANNKMTVAEADRLAKEIMSGKSSNRHTSEERGHVVDDSGMTEEDLYSSVQRNPRAPGPGPTSQQTPAQGGAPAAPQPSAKMPAWGTAGAGVAVLSASSSGSWIRPATVKTASQPIPVDSRREHNKVRQQLTGGGVPVKDRSSPYGTPKVLRSPMSSPLISDAKSMAALDLNPGVARVGEEARKSFIDWKAQNAAEKAKSDQVDRHDAITKLRAFSQDGKASSDAGAAASPSSTSELLSDTAKAESETGGNSSAAVVGTPVESSAGSVVAAEVAPKKTNLNPFAKSFSFNPMAKEWAPPTGADTAAPSPAATGTPGPPPSVNSRPRQAPPSSNVASSGRPITGNSSQSPAPNRNNMMARPNHQRGPSGSGNQMGHYSSSPLQHMGSGGLNHRPLMQHSPHRDNRMPPGNSGPPGGGPMLSIPMQGSMPMGMSMQQGVYGGMGPGQPPMYMAGPPYGMHPGSPQGMMMYGRPQYALAMPHNMMPQPGYPHGPMMMYQAPAPGGPGSPGGPRPPPMMTHPMMMPHPMGHPMPHYMQQGPMPGLPGPPAPAPVPAPAVRSSVVSNDAGPAPAPAPVPTPATGPPSVAAPAQGN